MNDLHYAVVVGINRYPAISDLQAARGDAVRFRDWLIDSKGGDVPEDNVTLVTATAEQERTADFMSAVPTRENVDQALYRANIAVQRAIEARPEEEWEAARQRTRLYFFLAGHGFMTPPNSTALLMANAAFDLLGNHLAVGQYLDWYESSSPFREIVCFADCCRTSSGNGSMFPFGPPFTTTAAALEKVDCFVGYATSQGDPAYEQQNADPDLARGHFTTALLDGLGGRSANRKGLITSDSLADYVVRHVEVPEVVADARAERRSRAVDPVDRVQRYVGEIASVEDKSVADVLSTMEPKELSRRTGLPHKAVDKAIEELRRPRGE